MEHRRCREHGKCSGTQNGDAKAKAAVVLPYQLIPSVPHQHGSSEYNDGEILIMLARPEPAAKCNKESSVREESDNDDDRNATAFRNELSGHDEDNPREPAYEKSRTSKCWHG